MSWNLRAIGATICGVVCALCLFGGAVHASPASHASPQCTGSCIWWDKDESGWGSNGTGVAVTLPGYVSSNGGYDGVEGAAWIVAYPSSPSIETGAVYGYTDSAGSYKNYFYPIATQNDGDNEHTNDNYQATSGGTYILRSFHNAGNKLGFSFFNDQYDTPIWSVGWGTYDTGYAENMTANEVHGNGDQPIWSDKFHFANAQWRDNNDNWNLWGFLNVNQDCPYHGVYLSSTSWDAYSSGC